MKILKYLLFLLLIAFIAGSIYIATKNGDYQMERSAVIKAPVSLIYEEINNLENWPQWEPWNEEDVIVSVSEKSSGPEATLSWKSDAFGDGNVTTTENIPNNSILQKMQYQTAIGETNGAMYWNFKENSNGVKVTWGIKGDLDFKDKLGLFLGDTKLTKLFAPIFEQGLSSLEKNVLHEMDKYNIHVDGITRHGGGYYMYSTSATRLNEVYGKTKEMLTQIRLYMNENNVSVNGNPFILYNKRNEANGTTIFSVAIPTTSMVVTPSGSPVLNGFLPPQQVVKTTLKGHYKNATEAWETAYRYILENNLKVQENGEPFEILITGPNDTQNPAAWITEIYIPVEAPLENQDAQ